jgi:hypothetical protein
VSRVLPRQDLSGWVSGVDDDDGLRDAALQRLGVRPLQLVQLQRPVALLVQVVADLEKTTSKVA